MTTPTDETIKKVMQELGRRGGKKSSEAKTEATKKSLEKARAARWPKKKAGKEEATRKKKRGKK